MFEEPPSESSVFRKEITLIQSRLLEWFLNMQTGQGGKAKVNQLHISLALCLSWASSLFTCFKTKFLKPSIFKNNRSHKWKCLWYLLWISFCFHIEITSQLFSLLKIWAFDFQIRNTDGISIHGSQAKYTVSSLRTLTTMQKFIGNQEYSWSMRDFFFRFLSLDHKETRVK